MFSHHLKKLQLLFLVNDLVLSARVDIFLDVQLVVNHGAKRKLNCFTKVKYTVNRNFTDLERKFSEKCKYGVRLHQYFFPGSRKNRHPGFIYSLALDPRLWQDGQHKQH